MSGRLIKQRRGGYSLVEVLVGLAIMLAGLVAIATSFPQTLSAQRDAELMTIAAALAQMKAEEIRRDNDQNNQLIKAIQELEAPTEPIVFLNEPRLSYAFASRSVRVTEDLDPDDPRQAIGVPRVIIRYAPQYRPSQDVVYELRFNASP